MSETTTVTTPLSFEERMMAKLRDDIGAMMSDAELKAILERGIDKAFFQTRTIPSTDRWQSTTTKPSLVEEVIERHIKDRLTAAVEQWLRDNHDKVEALVLDAAKKGIGEAVLYSLEQRFNGLFQSALSMLPRNSNDGTYGR